MKLNKLSFLRSLFSHFGRSPVRSRQRWARSLAWLGVRLMRSRAHIVRTNLALCFPERSPQDRERWLHQHFYLLAQSVVDRGLFWFGQPSTILNTIPISGLEHLERLLTAKRKIILLAPHFIGLDAAATRLTMFLHESATMYTRQSDSDVDQLVREGRGRFNQVHLVSRHDGVRGLIRHLRNGIPVYYLPDMDFGVTGAAFLPFFNIPAATLLTTAQIAKAWDAAVVPIISRLDPESGQYKVSVLPPLEDFPGEQSPENATKRLNQLIETWVRIDPPQYYWVHRRFKTRPQGQERFY
ncbi:acyltransferase [Candidimonas sp. SYP-B2681]|uniref:lysophospholipid acyltransferase family protein n=1 Tax=Candidimonas sp. SYP-B2681 TaxID=2497686 RepID=UPI000F887A7A|nr:lysophospholipid acyltransferase family protein [Candidimonas sp. SYP-B2681]RTZ45686.1 acyltransferase [Candidimonas sp. SYP-B2681]